MTKEQAINLLIAFGEENIIARTDVGIAFRMAIKSLEEERPKGEWKLRKINQGWEVYCSKCGKGKGFTWDEVFLEDYKKHPQHAYCSYCGADMRESEVEE